MDTNAIVIITGLVALLIAHAAVQDAGGGTPPSSIVWRFSESWTTSVAALVAITSIFFLSVEADIVVMFGLMLLLGPLIYKGFAAANGASMPLFMAVGTLMGWATLAIFLTVIGEIFHITRGELSIVPRLVLNGFAIAAVLAAAAAISSALRAGASGRSLTDGAWKLP